jgi:hypothetical protein
MQFNAPNVVDIINLFFRNRVVTGVGFHDCSAVAKLDLIVIVEEVEGVEPVCHPTAGLSAAGLPCSPGFLPLWFPYLNLVP